MNNDIFAPVLDIIANHWRIGAELDALRDQQRKTRDAYRTELIAMQGAIRDNPDDQQLRESREIERVYTPHVRSYIK